MKTRIKLYESDIVEVKTRYNWKYGNFTMTEGHQEKSWLGTTAKN